MSERGSVDLDLLADYVGGALVGTPEEAHVAQLVINDPAWRGAADDLAAAMHAVAMDLAVFGSSPEPMPPDVANRLDEALQQAAPARSAVGERVASRTVRSEVRRGVPARSKTRRWAGPLALATLVVAIGAIAVPQLLAPRNEGPASIAEWRKGASPELYNSAPQVAYTGKDYSADSFPRSFRNTGTPSTTPLTQVKPLEEMAAPADTKGGVAPAGLERLATPAGLAACLQAVNQALPGHAQWVDLAYYQGRPAALIVILANTGRWVFVADPSCGIAGPAEIYRAALA